MNPLPQFFFRSSGFFLAVISLLAVLIFSAHASENKQLYTCGMHPSVIQDHPGNCPICGMKLTPIRNSGASPEASANPSAIAVDAATRQNMNLRTAPVQRGPLRKTIRTVGTIDYNETALADVTTTFKGWVEKLEVDATGRLVHRGETLFEVYSPELYNIQSEYLLALHSPGSDPGAAALRESAANKLRFFDVPEAQIVELEKTRTLRKTLPVVAPTSGFVIEKNIVQGQMVDAGMKLYRLADLGVVWVMAQVYEQDLPFVKLGQDAVVKVASLPDREFHGRVAFIYPTVDEKTRTAKVRLEFENPGYFLKPGMFVSASIRAQLESSAVLVPESAVLRSGTRNTVFVSLDGGRFEGRDVALGVESENGLIQVSRGLNEGEQVVTSGQFLLDSESQLREAIEKMHGPTSPAQPADAAPISLKPDPAAQTKQGASLYICPMPEHVSIAYDHPGKCPVCDMTLVSTTSSALAKIQAGDRVLYYTCPMPEHAHIHAANPGKCPLCAMTLIPMMGPSETPSLYHCPMHPEITSDKPGLCPKCEMDLVPVKNPQ